MDSSDVIFIIDRSSFPVRCGELDDFISVIQSSAETIIERHTESPTEFFRFCLDACEPGKLAIPVTRNMFVRDRLRQEGVDLVVCL